MKTKDMDAVHKGNVLVTGNSTTVLIEMPKEEVANYCTVQKYTIWL